MPDHARAGRRRSARADAVELSELFDALHRRRSLALAVGLAVLVAGMTWAAFQAPEYRASATVKLENNHQDSGVLSDLAALTSAPAAEGEISILSSRALIDATIAESPQSIAHTEPFTPASSDDLELGTMEELGLTTRVESRDRLPIRDLLTAFGSKSRGPERLFASLTPTDSRAPRDVRVRFVEGDRVRLSSPGRFGLPDQDSVEVDYRSGEEIDFHGSRLKLEATGDYVGTEHLVTRISREDCVDSLVRRVEVEETSRNSGVLRVTVSDSDPARAAELANALCRNYLVRSIRVGRARADQTIRFIDKQLEEQQKSLESAESEVVKLQSANPALIEVSAVAATLFGRLSELEADRAKISSARTGLAEAVTLLEAGNLDALARLSRELPDLVSLSYIEAVGKLGAESLALERSDAGTTKLMLAKELQDLALARHESEERLAALDHALDALRKGDLSALASLFAEAPELAATDPSTAQYLSECARLDAELSASAGDLTPQNPRIAALNAARQDLQRKITTRLESAATGLRLACADRKALEDSSRTALESWPVEERSRIDSAVKDLVSRVAGNLQARTQSLTNDEAALGTQISDVERELGELPEHAHAVADPLRRREAHAQIVKLLLDSRQQAQLSAAATLPVANLVDPAVPPQERYAPRLFFHFVLFAAVGLGAALLSVLLRQASSGAIYSEAEVEEATGLAVFGAIPEFSRWKRRMRAAGGSLLSLRDDPKGPLSESYRSLREALRSTDSTERPLRSFGVTSCARNEGKTTTNINLSFAFAESDKRVLLVDADLRMPMIHETFGVPLSPGLSEVLEKRSSWRECVHSAGQNGLDVLCAGELQSSPSELLGSTNFHALIAEWGQVYDLVVFDMPPTLVVADVQILARELDGIIVLYRSGGVHRDVLSSAVHRLRLAGANVLGAVVNAIRPSRAAGSSYGYGDAYGYHYGGAVARKRGSSRAQKQAG